MTKIMISLVAVVLLILIIGFFAMRFLRADDGDELDDRPQERGRSRGGDADDHDRRGEDRVIPLARRSERGRRSPGRAASDEPARRPGRSGRKRQDREDRTPLVRAGGDLAAIGQSQFFDDQGVDDQGSDRASRRGKRSSAATGLYPVEEGPRQRRPAGRAATPVASTTGRASRATSVGSGTRSGADWDSLSDVDYWAEVASDKPLTTTAQPAGHPGSERSEWAERDAAPNSRQGLSARGARQDESTALLPVRRPHTPTGPGNPARLSADAGRPVEAPQPARFQPQGRPVAGRPGQDQPAAGPPAQLPPAQLPPAQAGRVAAQRRDVGTARNSSPGLSSPGLPSPGTSSPGYGRAARRGRDLRSVPYDDPLGLPANGRSPAERESHQGIAALVNLGHGPGGPAPLDDDPLTSPSFPAIRGSDSRSYRTGRSDTSREGSSAPAGLTAAQPPPHPQNPAQQTLAYPVATADPLSDRGGPSAGGRSDWTDDYRQHSGGAADSTGPNAYGTGPDPGTRQRSGSTDPDGYGTGPTSYGTGPNRYSTDPDRHGTGPNRYSTDPNRHGTDPNRHGTDPNRHGTDPDGYSTSPTSYGTGPNSYGTGPNTYEAGPGTRRPEPATAGYREYAEQPPRPSGNPYGSYVSAPAAGYPAPATASGRPDSDSVYGDQMGRRDTRQYSQPTSHQPAADPLASAARAEDPLHSPAPVHAAPVYSAPVYAAPVYAVPIPAAPERPTPLRPTPLRPTPLPATPGHAAPERPTPSHAAPSHAAPSHAGSMPETPVHAAPGQAMPTPGTPITPASGARGAAWYGAPGAAADLYSDQPRSFPEPPARGYGHQPAHGRRGSHSEQPAHGYQATGGQAAHAPRANGYPGAEQGPPDYSSAPYPGTQYGQAPYAAPDRAGVSQDQHGYGSPDSGYGADAYGGYPSY